VVVVPAAFAVGEETGASGPDVLAAIAVGYEVATRLGRLAPGTFQHKGFHATSVLGIFGATAAVCRLFGLDENQAVRAAGIAGSFSSGLMAYLSDGTDTKPIHAGWAAQGAIRAVQLTKHGASGPATVIEGLAGVFPSFVGLQIDPADALVALGSDWSGLAVATKPYPACHCVHAAVDCWKTIRDREGLTADDIPKIGRLTGLLPSWYRHLVCDPIEAKRQPRSVYEARFSLPYAVARAVVDGDLSLASFDGDKIGDPAVLDVAKKVDYEELEYPEFPSAFPGGLRVEMEDGRVFEEHLRHNVGSAGNPMTDEQLHAKFVDAAEKSANPQPGDALLAALRAFESDVEPWEPFRAAMTCFDAGDQ
jgi:2-methylcitrate dehydratase PrpD